VPGPTKFSKGVELKFTKVKLTGPGMKAIDTGPAKLDPGDNTLLTIPITTLPDGKYKIDWRVVSTDGHKTNGTYGFESMK
jgi:copper resistance protein C